MLLKYILKLELLAGIEALEEFKFSKSAVSILDLHFRSWEKRDLEVTGLVIFSFPFFPEQGGGYI